MATAMTVPYVKSWKMKKKIFWWMIDWVRYCWKLNFIIGKIHIFETKNIILTK